jgi:hypothetical protein
MRTAIAVIIIVIVIVGTGGGIYFYNSCAEQRDDITRKTGIIAGSIEGVLGLIDSSLTQQVERYNSQCGWLTGGFNFGGEANDEPVVSPEVTESEFLDNYYSLVNASSGVTEAYHKEIEKWERGEYDDLKLVEITDSFLPQYDLLVDRASGIEVPQRYQEALDLYISSLRSERASYALFRDFIETGDPKLNETSIDLLTNSTKYELESFSLINTEREKG